MILEGGGGFFAIDRGRRVVYIEIEVIENEE